MRRARTQREPSGLPDAPLETTSLADEIAFRLQAAIIARTLPPGARLRQEELCERFKVSRTPIREALRKLQALRLVVMTPNRGTVVRIPAREEVGEAYDLRAELEGYAAERACALASSETDRALAVAIGSVRRRRRTGAKDQDERTSFSIQMSGAIRTFHSVIYETAGNNRLVEIIRELEASFPVSEHPAEGEVVQIDEHEAIRAAIRERDGATARRLMREHILHSKDLLLAHLDEQGFWQAAGAGEEQ